MAVVVVISGLFASDRALWRAVVAGLRRGAGDDLVVVDHDAGEPVPAGPIAAVVHLAGACADDDCLDNALSEDVTRTAVLAELAAARGAPFVFASRLSVVGARRGLAAEADPREVPFGGSAVRGGDVDVGDVRRSLSERGAFARATVDHADAIALRRQRVRDDVVARGGPGDGPGYEAAVARARDTALRAAQRRALVEAAAAWRFPTASAAAVRGFTRALGELVAVYVSGDVSVTIVRLPAVMAARRSGGGTLVIEDDVLPAPALWRERRRIAEGAVRLPPAPRTRIEALPADLVVEAVVVAVRGAIAGGAGVTVAHLVAHPETPLSLERVTDLLDLRLRRQDSQRPAAARLLGVSTRAALPAPLDATRAVAAMGARGVAAAAAKALARAPGAAKITGEVEEALSSLGSPSAEDVAALACAPFVHDDVRFASRGLRMLAARAGLDPVDARVDWRTFMLQRHLPLLDDRLRARRARDKHRAKEPVPAYASLAHLAVSCADRYGSRPALSLFLPPDQGAAGARIDVSYGELLARARAVAARLAQAGIGHGDRVVIAGANHPAWGIVAFGALLLGAVLVPLDPNLEDAAARVILAKARAAIAVVDKGVRAKIGDALAALVERPVLDLHLTATAGPSDGAPELARDALPNGDDLASILFTSGTTGDPKGVMLTHHNFCALLGSLQSVFPVTGKDRLLSVLPLHHTFEFTCGLLMPLACGAQIFTPDALVGDRVTAAMKNGRITAIVGVPALWQLLERRMKKTAEDGGALQASVFQTLLSLNTTLGKRFGVSLGPILLKKVHDQLGGHLRVLISGGSALPPSTHELFQGIGLPLAEGYGLTESAPVLTVAEGKLGMPAGTVGTPIPGVTLKLVDPDTGVDVTNQPGAMGELWASAPNVMRGYFDNETATRAVLTDDGWLKTGDLGTIDADGRVRIVGRSKDVVVTAAGENIYLDDTEKRLESIDGVSELSLLGIDDQKGGERLCLVFVAADDKGQPTADPALVQRARQLVGQRVLKLPAFSRPAVIESWHGPLPRTASRKVKRREVKKAIEALLARRALEQHADDDNVVQLDERDAVARAVIDAVAQTAGIEPARVTGSTSLPGELGFDSLMWVELQGQIERQIGGALDPEVLVTKETVAEVIALARDAQARGPQARGDADHQERLSRERGATGTWPPLVEEALGLVVQAPTKAAARAALSTAQRQLFATGFDTRVVGEAFIPQNRSVIVVANHTSHLDTGLVKYALGAYGQGLRPLAAKDYFFEGNPLKVAFFTHLTNLVPIDRETGSGLAFEQARAVVEAGHVVLIYPEGTRREDGTLGAFKPLVAKLALATNTDVLPLYLDGCFAAFPRGASRPRFGASLTAHIGPPLLASELARLTAHLPAVQGARAAAEIIRRAVVGLRDGEALELSRVETLERMSARTGSAP